jgi:rhamnose transport system substrate-binding protein
VKTNNKQEFVLGILILVEIAIFSTTGRNFFSLDNFFECIRLSTEIGLLALALTPVIVSGGIDLSVGSMMGLCAVAFGAMWHDAHLPVILAIVLTLMVSMLGGALNAALIAGLNFTPWERTRCFAAWLKV